MKLPHEVIYRVRLADLLLIAAVAVTLLRPGWHALGVVLVTAGLSGFSRWVGRDLGLAGEVKDLREKVVRLSNRVGGG